MKRCIARKTQPTARLFTFRFHARAGAGDGQALPSPNSPETNVSERVRLLESELERQNAKLDQLQKTLSEQQATIQALAGQTIAQPIA